MARVTPRRVTIGASVSVRDLEAVDKIAADAGVKRSDVARLGVEVLLRGLDRERLVVLLVERGRESGAPLTPEQWERLTSTD